MTRLFSIPPVTLSLSLESGIYNIYYKVTTQVHYALEMPK